MCSSFQMFLKFHRSHLQAGFVSRVLFICKRVLRYVYSKTCVKRTLKIDKTKILMTNGSLMKVESIAECSPWSILQYF